MPPFLSAEWRDLAVLNYEVDPALLLPLVPAGTELDLWRGRAIASLVGFRFLRTRLLGIPIPFHRDFEEFNLRFYVRREAEDGLRRGVVFVREIVPRAAVAWAARTFYNERYMALPMSHHKLRLDGPPGPSSLTGAQSSNSARGATERVEYRWRLAGREGCLGVSISGEPSPLERGSEEEFILEHYWGYTRQRDGGTLEYSVEHPSWRVWRGADPTFQGDAAALYGSDLARALEGLPASAFLAEGSPVVVHWGRKVGDPRAIHSSRAP